MLSKCVVRWADGSHDNKRTCDECGTSTCSFPVYSDYYREKVTRNSYWNYLGTKGGTTLDGANIYDNTLAGGEPKLANPDSLEEFHRMGLHESESLASAVKADKAIAHKFAWSKLSTKQQEAWKLVKQEGLSHAQAGLKLGLTKAVISDRLLRARKRYEKFLGEYK